MPLRASNALGLVGPAVRRMSETLGRDAALVAEAGTALSVQQAVDLDVACLREAATDQEA